MNSPSVAHEDMPAMDDAGPAPAAPAAGQGPRVRADVSTHRYSEGRQGSPGSHVIRCKTSSNYVLTSALGVRILECLDGSRSPGAVADHVSERWGANVPLAKITEFLDICAANGFLEEGSWGAGRRIVVPSTVRRERLGLYSKVYNADEALDLILEYRRWWLNPVTKLLAGLLFLAGVANLFMIPSGGGLVAPVKQLDMSFTDVFLLLLPFAFMVELALHELGHALSCRLMGARPKGFGMGLLWGFMPILFTDTTDAYTIKDKRKRMFISFAGPMVDVMFFGLVMMLYWSVPADSLSAKLLLAYSAFPLSSAVLSLNPFFIRMDGYWILADWLDKPNLRRAAMRYLKEAIRRRPKGGAPEAASCSHDPSPREKRIYIGYIVVATTWTVAYLGYVMLETGVTLYSLIGNFFGNSIFL